MNGFFGMCNQLCLLQYMVKDWWLVILWKRNRVKSGNFGHQVNSDSDHV